MNPASRLLKSTADRPTRFHDRQGRFMDLASLPSLPLTAAEFVLQVGFGRKRAVPWISYRATRALQRLIRPEWRVLEFGAGGSTVWFAERAAFVLSLESSPDWHRRVLAMLALRNLANARVELRPADCASYTEVADPDGSFDLALIDGDCRDACAAVCARKVRSGGYVYLDNTDQPPFGMAAEAALLRVPAQWRRYYRDFAPGLPAVGSGLLIRLQ